MKTVHLLYSKPQARLPIDRAFRKALKHSFIRVRDPKGHKHKVTAITDAQGLIHCDPSSKLVGSFPIEALKLVGRHKHKNKCKKEERPDRRLMDAFNALRANQQLARARRFNV